MNMPRVSKVVLALGALAAVTLFCLAPFDSVQADSLGIDKAQSAAGDLPTTLNAAQVIQRGINWLFGIAAVVALAIIVWGGFAYMLALGDEKKASTAKNIILYAIIGLLIIGFSFAIISVVRDLIFGAGSTSTSS